MELSLTYYFLLFMIYACGGWLLEVTCKLIEYKRFINRGFLIGPYCPIYGFGAIAITLLLYRYSYDPFVLFVMTIITCGTIEYVTSWAMEKLYKARWWDYSRRKFNLNGRICLGTIIPFGVFGLILTYITNPFLINLLNKGDIKTLNIVAIVLFIIYMIDNIISTIVISGFRKTAVQIGKEGTGDDTEQITNKVREILAQRSWGYKRLINAFPHFETIKTKIQEITDDVKENARELKENINEKADDIKNTINDKKEEVKNNISEKTEIVRNGFTDTKRAFSNGIKHKKRKAKVTLRLERRKIKRRFKRNKK